MVICEHTLVVNNKYGGTWIISPVITDLLDQAPFIPVHRSISQIPPQNLNVNCRVNYYYYILTLRLIGGEKP